MPIITKNKNKEPDDEYYKPEDRAPKNNKKHTKDKIYNYNSDDKTKDLK